MNKKTIWITGGSTGIGKALAIKFANEGWNVAISARREQLLEEISNEYENISSFPLDVTNKSNPVKLSFNILTDPIPVPSRVASVSAMQTFHRNTKTFFINYFFNK